LGRRTVLTFLVTIPGAVPFFSASACTAASLMGILLVIGVMDLRAMAVATAAITVERLAPDGERVVRATGLA
jgi:predicted metal-binding membrane protein